MSRIGLLLCLALLGAAPPREVNITTDSAPGWLPSEAQERQALAAVDRFFAALDGGGDRRAYDMMTQGNRAAMTAAQFAEDNRRFRTQAGTLRQRRILKVTWTKDPANAPSPGVYAAIDVAARFANVDRQCGYVVVFQRSPDAGFEVMRTESNFIDNTSAQPIEREQSRAELDRIWAGLARNCPNFTADTAR